MSTKMAGNEKELEHTWMKQFEQFKASMLFCPGCKQAVPVRERLLLVLADGDLYDYKCVYCAGSVGTRKETQTKEVKIII